MLTFIPKKQPINLLLKDNVLSDTVIYAIYCDATYIYVAIGTALNVYSFNENTETLSYITNLPAVTTINYVSGYGQYIDVCHRSLVRRYTFDGSTFTQVSEADSAYNMNILASYENYVVMGYFENASTNRIEGWDMSTSTASFLGYYAVPAYPINHIYYYGGAWFVAGSVIGLFAYTLDSGGFTQVTSWTVYNPASTIFYCMVGDSENLYTGISNQGTQIWQYNLPTLTAGTRNTDLDSRGITIWNNRIVTAYDSQISIGTKDLTTRIIKEVSVYKARYITPYNNKYLLVASDYLFPHDDVGLFVFKGIWI